MTRIIAVMLVLITCAACEGSKTSLLSSGATVQAEVALTETYGAEANRAIENFESNWLSLDAYKQPDLQRKLAIEQFIHVWGLVRASPAVYEEPWLTTKAATVSKLSILDYAPEKFKAIAHVIKLREYVMSDGKLIRVLPPKESCGLYVFVREDGIWKLATQFDMTVPQDIDRDWLNEPGWSTQLIGDLPRDACE